MFCKTINNDKKFLQLHNIQLTNSYSTQSEFEYFTIALKPISKDRLYLHGIINTDLRFTNIPNWLLKYFTRKFEDKIFGNLEKQANKLKFVRI